LINTDRAIGLALVVTELVANAARHAYPEDQHGSVWVRLARGDGEIGQISVSDEGVGLSADFETNKKVGFGMRVVRALARQTRAQLRIERRARGTEFVLEIPPSTSGAMPAD
jgi:two-component sensor histidine kinase